uniref:Uncharacterized protein n=2 Tax=Parascaris univalens TaxID=6257 RepID=A0A915C068_PARUN
MSSKSSSFHSEGNSSTREANISAYSDSEPYSDYGVDSSSNLSYSFSDVSTDSSVDTAISYPEKGENKELSLKTARSEGGGDLVLSLSTAYTEGTSEVSSSESATFSDSPTVDTAKEALAECTLTSVGDSANTARSVDEFVLPEPVFSDYSLEPSETAVEFPEEDIQETDTLKTARLVDGIVLPKPIYSEYSTEPSEMAIEFSDKSFDNSGIEDKCNSELSTAADGFDSRLGTAKSIGNSESESDEPRYPQINARLTRIPHYTNEEFHSIIRNAFTDEYPPSEYVLSELNENAIDFSAVIRKPQQENEENEDVGQV